MAAFESSPNAHLPDLSTRLRSVVDAHWGSLTGCIQPQKHLTQKYKMDNDNTGGGGEDERKAKWGEGHILAMKEKAGLKAFTLNIKIDALFLTGEMRYMWDLLAKELITWWITSFHSSTTSYTYMFYPRVQSCVLLPLLSLFTVFISEQLPWQQNDSFSTNIHATNINHAEINAKEQVAPYRFISYVCSSLSVCRKTWPYT